MKTIYQISKSTYLSLIYDSKSNILEIVYCKFITIIILEFAWIQKIYIQSVIVLIYLSGILFYIKSIDINKKKNTVINIRSAIAIISVLRMQNYIETLRG